MDPMTIAAISSFGINLLKGSPPPQYAPAQFSKDPIQSAFNAPLFAPPPQQDYSQGVGSILSAFTGQKGGSAGKFDRLNQKLSRKF